MKLGSLLYGFLVLAPSLPHEEFLRYNLNWPSGISLGELTWSTTRPAGPADSEWTSELTLEAAVPAFPIRDVFHSSADRDLCSISNRKEVTHGKKHTEESTSFDRAGRRAIRQTKSGGKTEMTTSGCARDLLGFLNFTRTELAAGRIPPPQTVYFGAPYAVTLDFAGAATVAIAGQNRPCDRLTGTIKGPASQTTFELLFARDPGRTLLSARVPIPIGTLSIELVP